MILNVDTRKTYANGHDLKGQVCKMTEQKRKKKTTTDRFCSTSYAQTSQQDQEVLTSERQELRETNDENRKFKSEGVRGGEGAEPVVTF
jgi:hypothetical protein